MENIPALTYPGWFSKKNPSLPRLIAGKYPATCSIILLKTRSIPIKNTPMSYGPMIFPCSEATQKKHLDDLLPFTKKTSLKMTNSEKTLCSIGKWTSKHHSFACFPGRSWCFTRKKQWMMKHSQPLFCPGILLFMGGCSSAHERTGNGYVQDWGILIV